MPRLPDASSLGPRRGPQPQAGVASIDAEALKAASRANANLGIAAESIAEDWKKHNDQVAKLAAEETKRLNAVRAEDAVNAAHDLMNDLRFGEEGYSRVQGGDLVQRPEVIKEYSERLQTRLTDLYAGLANDEQRELARRRIAPSVVLYRRDLLSHYDKEWTSYEREVSETTIALSKREIVENHGNADVQGLAAARMESAIARQAQLEGWSVEKRAARSSELRTEIASGIIDRLLANRQDGEAATYYESVRGKLNPEVATKIEHALTVTRERRASEAEAQRKAQAAELTSDVEIAVRRGRAGYAQIEQAYRSGILSPAKRTELTVHLDTENKAAGKRDAEERASIQRVQGALGGAGFLDFRNGDDRKAVDSYFGKVLAPSLQKAKLEPGESAQIVANFTARTGIVPAPIRETIRGALRAGDPVAKAQAADFMDRLKTANPAVLDDFSDQDIRLGNLIGTYTRAGVAPAKAVELAQGALNVPKPELDAREQRYADDKVATKNRKRLATELTGFRWIGPSQPKQVPDALAGEFETLVRNEFSRSGDLEASQKTALDHLKRVWGVTSTGKEPRWMKYAPETVYGIPGEDPAWIRDQLRRDLKKNSLFDGEPDLSLAADSITARESRPSYVVLQKRDGVLEPLIGKDGKPLRFRPDFGTSEAGARRRKALEAQNEAAAGILAVPGAELPAVTGRAKAR